MPLSPGDKLGPYEILAPIGAGGMGEVWKARDTRLDRIVAIKQLKSRHTPRRHRHRSRSFCEPGIIGPTVTFVILAETITEAYRFDPDNWIGFRIER
jgi:serine/threonine protein kinase